MVLEEKMSEAYMNEEIFWSQKARSKWLKEGHKNTTYFHASVKTRRKRCRISTLQKYNGGWCKTKNEIRKEIETNYQDLFSSTQTKCFDDLLEGIP